MKFHLNHDPANKTLTIPRAALQLSGLAETSDLTIHTENGCVLLLPDKMSVAQTLKTFQLLTAINAELLFRLAKSSALAHGAENDACDGCHWEKECFQDVLPLCMLAEAGIDPEEGDFEWAVMKEYNDPDFGYVVKYPCFFQQEDTSVSAVSPCRASSASSSRGASSALP